MSATATETKVKVKKRKQNASLADDLPGPSTSKKPRKEKSGAGSSTAVVAELAPAVQLTSVEIVPDTASSTAKKEKKKSKSRAVARDDGGDADDGEFSVVRAATTVSIPPVFAANARAGVEEMLDSMLMRYIPALEGVVLTHSNLTFPSPKAVILRDCPFAVARIEFDATLWRPRVGMKLKGKVKICSPDHVALLIHRTFNASIPRHHLPKDEWTYEHGPAENDPEFGEIAGEEAEGEKKEEDDEIQGGRWVNKLTNEKLGDEGLVEFTVIGLTVANQMLSLLGSLQPDPFSPKHAPAVPESTSKPSKHSSRPAPQELDEDGEGVASEDGEMEGEGEVNVEAAAAEERRRQEELAEEEKMKKGREKAQKRERKERKRKMKEEAIVANETGNGAQASDAAEVAGENRKKRKTV